MVPTLTRMTDKPPTLEEAQKAVGGFVELIVLRDGSQMLINEEGRMHNLPPNIEASILAEEYGPIVGNVLILSGKARWLEEAEGEEEEEDDRRNEEE